MARTHLFIGNLPPLCYIKSMDEQPVHFNPDDRDYLRPGDRQRGLVGLVMRLAGGRIKNEHSANIVLFVFALAVFFLSVVIFFVWR